MNQTYWDVWYRKIREIVEDTINQGRSKRRQRTNIMGTIDPAYTSGRPMVIMDDDTSGTPVGPYPYLNTYAPSGGDRVLLGKAGSKYVILGKIV